ncbi:MAG: MBL fold metallo-hydrolase [Bacillota bacterium]
MKISWLGHACFLIETTKKILTDPFDRQLGYPAPKASADLVTVSHQHFDHNAVQTIPGKPQIVQSAGEHSVTGVKITGIRTFHDQNRGAQRGENIIFVIEAEGIRVCHLGDLGHTLDRSTRAKIGKVDVLLVPVGGYYTINAAEAKEVVEQLNPGYAVPMHYKTKYLTLPIAPVDDFLKFYPGYKKETALEVQAGKMPEKTQVVLLELTR